MFLMDTGQPPHAQTEAWPGWAFVRALISPARDSPEACVPVPLGVYCMGGGVVETPWAQKERSNGLHRRVAGASAKPRGSGENLPPEIISLYALAAILFRTWWDGFTPNRITVIGWNLINIALLGVLLVREWRGGDERWVAAAHRTFAQAMPVYAAWSLLLLVALPLLFARLSF